VNRAQRRAAARAGIDPQALDLARCPDCDSDVSVAELVPGVFGADVRHDDSCPRWRMIAADRGNTP